MELYHFEHCLPRTERLSIVTANFTDCQCVTDRQVYSTVQYSTLQYSTVFLRGGPHYLTAKTEGDSIRNHQHMVIGVCCRA